MNIIYPSLNPNANLNQINNNITSNNKIPINNA